ncbi:cytochrome c biogenesis protein CcmE ['Osedax' symbiont bacterium Rs2_46_30_T18]|nr:cytochrome c biogenesis protein CcmE ['Osedax' symbiont bacterium Rs2_46_30_T18]
MTPKRKNRLMLVLFVVLGGVAAVGLGLYAIDKGVGISVFYSPQQIADGEAPADTRIRAGGMVQQGSVKRDPNSLRVEFVLTDYQQNLTVIYKGILPDLFREGQGIVAQGELDKHGVFQAVEVLAKHDEKYMPPEVADALEKAGVDASGEQLESDAKQGVSQ